MVGFTSPWHEPPVLPCTGVCALILPTLTDTRQSAISPEASDEDGAGVAPQQWGIQGDGALDHDMDPGSPSGSGKSHTDTDEKQPADGPSVPIQKRRRVTRACDECRRKKIKCDGKQPCTHCSVYSYGRQTRPRIVARSRMEVEHTAPSLYRVY